MKAIPSQSEFPGKTCVQAVLRPLFGTLWTHFAPNSTFLSGFQEIGRHKLSGVSYGKIRSALERTNPGASNNGSDVEIRPLGTDLVTSEMTKFPEKRGFL